MWTFVSATASTVDSEPIDERDQLLKLCASISKEEIGSEKAQDKGLTHIILVADKSGSMSGNPFNQVQHPGA